MAHRNKVARSLESPCGTRCVDIFRRPDGSFGFAEYRRDPEDPSGWRATGVESTAPLASEAAALSTARISIGWLTKLPVDPLK